MRILIVEDNADITANLGAYLEPRGYVPDFATNGYGGLALMAQNEYDAVILDIGLPGMDGLELCRKIRNELRKSTPILMLTARDTERDKVSGFESGADDYLVKPFSLKELDMRLQALVRRARGQHQTPSLYRVGELSFDAEIYQATRAGVALTLTRTGYILLASLMRAAPNIVTREALEQAVWGEDRPDSDALRTHIHSLRQALDKPFGRPMLHTVQGIGYRLVNPDEMD